MKGFEPTEEFKNWAIGFSGCDGGDLTTGGIWFCGIEWGGGFTENEDIFKKHPKTLSPISVDDVQEALRRFQFNKKVAKLYSILMNEKIEDYVEVSQRNKLFGEGSGVVKLNLYPFSMSEDADHLWANWIFQKTGFLSKNIYRVWCQRHRFPFFASKSREYTPKVIICCGLNNRDAFLMAFGGLDNVSDLNLKEEVIDQNKVQKRFFHVKINSGKTLLVITPFFGWRKYDLNNDNEIEYIGKWINANV